MEVVRKSPGKVTITKYSLPKPPQEEETRNKQLQNEVTKVVSFVKK